MQKCGKCKAAQAVEEMCPAARLYVGQDSAGRDELPVSDPGGRRTRSLTAVLIPRPDEAWEEE